MQKNKSWVWVILVGFAIIGLFVWARMSNPNQALVASWNESGISCLVNGHQNLAQHIHPVLHITVDGTPEHLPANVGIVKTCLAEVHTHDETDVIHIETLLPNKHFMLKDFFFVLEKSLEREGYSLAMMVDGKPSTELGEHILADKEVIELRYISSGSGN
jgi:hypothetical protein